jgi:hypothetical protein
MWKWIRIPKGVALAAFVLPWMTVSCSGTKLVSATGFGLAFGWFSSDMPMGNAAQKGDAGISLWLILALAAIVAGLLLAFRENTRANARNLMLTSGVALLLIWVGTSRFSKSELLEAAARQNPSGNNQLDTAAAAMIRVDWHFGYWLAVFALVAAGVMAWLAFSGREAEVGQRLRGALGDVAAPKPHDEPEPEHVCPSCGRSFPATTRFCPDDGTALS